MAGSESRWPAAFERQRRMANARWEDTSSMASWANIEEEVEQPAGSQMPQVPESSAVQDDQPAPAAVPVQVPPPPPPAGGPQGGDQSGLGQAPAAKAAPTPVQQAAQSLINHTHDTPASRRLRRQQEQAQRRGRRGVRWGQMAPQNLAHNPLNASLPDHISQVGSGEGERSILIIDGRDKRVQSPFQGWLLDEVLTNALGFVNVRSDRHLVRSPSSGYHMNLFMVKTLDSVKVTICGSMTSYANVPCARWDALTGSVLAHSAFQPFRWPQMTETSATWVDVKLKLEGQLVLHLELRGYRGDGDMSVQLWHVSDAIHSLLQDTVFVPAFVVTIFQGWRVVATSWEVGGRLYACSEGGVVVALDFPLCHVEVRFVATASPDSFGADADRLEFRFLSAADRLDVVANTVQVPPTWLVCSRISGPMLIRNARWCRDHSARVECPDQALQLSQLAAVHAHWTATTEAPTEGETGPRISAIAVESNPINMHLVSESPLFRKERVLVKAEALALHDHDPLDEVIASVMPPVVDGPPVQPASSAPRIAQAALSHGHLEALSVTPVSHARPSMTDPGQAPVISSDTGSTLAPSGRTLEQRRADRMDGSAMTPQAFVEAVRQPARETRGGQSGVRIEEVHQTGPRSFAPALPEEITEV